jgi:hypothetical protein
MTVSLSKPIQTVPVDNDAFKEILENSANELAKEPSNQAKKALQERADACIEGATSFSKTTTTKLLPTSIALTVDASINAVEPISKKAAHASIDTCVNLTVKNVVKAAIDSMKPSSKPCS